MEESRSATNNAGMAHCSAWERKKNWVEEQKQVRLLTGVCASRVKLEIGAPLQYPRVVDEARLLETYQQYGGTVGVNGKSRPCIDVGYLPPGATTSRIRGHHGGLGGTHVLSPEYALNAKRRQALQAGLVNFNGELIEVHPSQVEPDSYFTPAGDLTQPQVCVDLGSLFVVIDPWKRTMFDTCLPRRVYGSVCPGAHLLDLYADIMADEVKESTKSVADCFDNFMMDKDPVIAQVEESASDSVLTYDSLGSTDLERQALRHYGEKDKEGVYVVEPRQVLKEIQMQTRKVHAGLVAEWLEKEEMRVRKAEAKLPRTERLSQPRRDMQERHKDVVRDLIHLHLRRVEEAFLNKMERDTVPEGYKAMFDGLETELGKMPGRTASIAFAHDHRLVADDISVFGHLWNWLGTYFERDCFIEGVPLLSAQRPSCRSHAARCLRPRSENHGRDLAAHVRAVWRRDLPASAVRAEGARFQLCSARGCRSLAPARVRATARRCARCAR
jgi:hypothetical protein